MRRQSRVSWTGAGENEGVRVNEDSMETFGVRGDHITLGQLLKMVGVIGTGGEAKYYLAETPVQVNGEAEQRRGRKLRPGDLVLAPGHPLIRLTAEEETPGDV